MSDGKLHWRRRSSGGCARRFSVQKIVVWCCGGSLPQASIQAKLINGTGTRAPYLYHMCIDCNDLYFTCDVATVVLV